MANRQKKSKIASAINLPPTWINQQNAESHQVQLAKNSAEYAEVISRLSGAPLNNLTRICRIQNPFLYGRYLIKKAEYKASSIPFQERIMLHATAASNVPSIIKNNLDWRYVKRCKFGKGVSFSPCAKYANKECSKNNGKQRAVLVCKVLVGRTHNGNYGTKIPAPGFDTTTGRKNKVYVKYYDDEFYPEYAVYYTNTNNTPNIYNTNTNTNNTLNNPNKHSVARDFHYSDDINYSDDEDIYDLLVQYFDNLVKR